jgi:hypothetical protein
MSSIMQGGHVLASPSASEAPPRVHVPPDAAAAGVPRYHKLSFPTYEGKEDPLGWLNRCERCFRAQLTREADKVWRHPSTSPEWCNSDTTSSNAMPACRPGRSSSSCATSALGHC